ncbi:MAG: hypothetical protein A3J83_03375 [Elusimicrobia bacterium RIFOXYA2_FULL_40_6]|nr:MAG: hypothetical protein A3J83_03375 [Elusimicrobia bacterium RIFOXYA2_FULL_40_6]
MKKLLIILLLSILFVPQLYSATNNFGIVLGNPWVGLRYNISRVFSAELRSVVDPDVSINSVRCSCNVFGKASKLKLFVGAEYGMINFNYEGVTGTGSSIAPYIGSECVLDKNMRLGLDFGYSTIELKSDAVLVSGPEYIFNLTMSYFIF